MMRSRLWLAVIQLAVALARAAAQEQPRTAQSPAPLSDASKAIATPGAVAALTQALINISTPEMARSSSSNTTLQFRPGQLLLKFRDLDGGNYSELVDRINAWAGIDLMRVSCSPG
jgi:hypothetical protein